MSFTRTRALWSWTAGVTFLLYAPLAVVGLYSFNQNRFLLLWSGVGLAGYREALSNTVLWQAFSTSLIVATATAALSVALGGLAGLALARDRGRWRVPFAALVGLVLVAPEIVAGIAYLMTFVAIGLDDGRLRLLVCHAVFATALVTMVVRARAQLLDVSLEDAAADLGATPIEAFRDVTLPSIRPALVAGACLSFAFSLDDVVMSAFVSTAGSVTLPVYIFSALRTGLKTEHAAAAMLMLAITLVMLSLAWRLSSRDLVAVARQAPRAQG